MWNYIKSSNNYKNNTVILITNDHGRHLNGIADGWANHGDKCDGCKHIGLLALEGPFKKGIVISEKKDLTQISATISELFELRMKTEKEKPLIKTRH